MSTSLIKKKKSCRQIGQWWRNRFGNDSQERSDWKWIASRLLAQKAKNTAFLVTVSVLTMSFLFFLGSSGQPYLPEMKEIPSHMRPTLSSLPNKHFLDKQVPVAGWD